MLLADASAVARVWQVALRGVDVTARADPMERGGSLLVDLSALAPALGVSVRADGEEIVIRDVHGTEWRAADGALFLGAATRRLPLKYPIRIIGTSTYLPIDAVAELAGLELVLSPIDKTAYLDPPQPGAEPVPGGWQTFTLEKTPEEKAQLDRIDGNATGGSQRIHLPPAHDSFQLGLGLGYVQGADWGAELTGSGMIQGVRTTFASLLTMGEKGLDVYSGYFSLIDSEFGWGAEGGALFSDIWGLARGVRYSWRTGKKRWHSLSVYLKTSHSGNEKTVVTYRDEIALFPDLTIGGELASDGSFLLKGRYERGRLSLHPYYRDTAQGSGDGKGVFASYVLWHGISLQGGVAGSGTGSDQSHWRNLSLRVPVRRGVDLTLAHTRTNTEETDGDVNAVMLSLPVGPVHMLARYQLLDSERLAAGAQGSWIGSQRRELMVSASYFANRRVSLNFQHASRWLEDGRKAQWEQLVASYRVSPRTQLQVISSFPDILAPDQLHVRLTRELSRDLALIAEYGRLSPFQTASIEPGERRFKITLRKLWSVDTPARGGEIRGLVIDQLHHPLAGAIVQLGNYQTATDDRGRYVFHHIPPGTYELRLDEESLPAHYSFDGTRRRLTITSRSRETVHFRVVPLSSITGRVYQDRDEDGQWDPGEGIPGVVVHLNGQVTATEREGSFGFYNVEPRLHTIRLDTDRLPPGYLLISPAEVKVELRADRPTTGIEFKLAKRDKEVIFQELA